MTTYRANLSPLFRFLQNGLDIRRGSGEERLPAVTVEIRQDSLCQILLDPVGKGIRLGLVAALGKSLPGGEITEPTVGIAEIKRMRIRRATPYVHRDFAE